MPTGKRLSQEEVNEIASEVKMGTMSKKTIAERHGIHPTSISKVLQRANGVKASPKRRTAKKPVKQQYTEIDWDNSLEIYIEARDAFLDADKHLKEVAKGLK